MTFTRRAFLAGGLSLVPLRAAALWQASVDRLRFDRSPFALGVASGDPSPDGAVLWTRLAPSPFDGGGMPPMAVPVTWEVATDERFRRVVQRGTTVARPEWAHSVHHEVRGLLPGRHYWYRFIAGGVESPVGRTKTLPGARSAADRVRFAFASCQHYEQGYYTAYRHMAAEDLDLVCHLGDYIYETTAASNANVARRHATPEPYTLDEYRTRYAQVHTDPDLQAAHAAFPWVVTPDDHEVDNDYAGVFSQEGVPVDVFLRRRAAAYQAYYEHMPLRRSSIPKGPWMRLYRQFSYGQLGSFFVLDTRQYRTDQPCGAVNTPLCEGALDPQATIMGTAQRNWLIRGLDRSRARWNIIPQQVMMARLDQGTGDVHLFHMDAWSGYDAERARLMKFFADRKPRNPVVLTGDIHTHWANDLKLNFDDERSPVVATELVGTSISSGGNGEELPENIKPILARNPCVKYFNSQRGYVFCDVSPARMIVNYRVLDYVTRQGSPQRTAATFVVEDGRCGVQRT